MDESPVIGVTTYPRELYDNGVLPQDNYRIPAPYVESIERAGGTALLIPPSGRSAERFLRVLDGLLLIGGGDVHPSRYGAEPGTSLMLLDDERDAFELALVEAALSEDLPVLGICRGIQVLNVALGGDLVQHIPDDFADGLDHAPFPSPPSQHPVRLEASSRLAAELGTVAFTVTSSHHQSVRTPGKGLQIVGTASDGVIEAIELSSHSWCIGVQWHPEIDAESVPVHQRLFTRFVQAAQRR